nr:phosphoribosyltransferase domain-containing protein [Paenisporosarcina indica]
MVQHSTSSNAVETAAGLGHSVFNHFQEAKYLHTTREE